MENCSPTTAEVGIVSVTRRRTVTAGTEPPVQVYSTTSVLARAADDAPSGAKAASASAAAEAARRPRALDASTGMTLPSAAVGTELQHSSR
ncbi:hypothetical protein GCM10010486_47820 [Nonomuraea roseoviolacea subsp. carminata]